MHTHRALVASALAGGILLTPTAALALDVPAPPEQGNVVDGAGLLSDAEERELNARIDEGNRSTDGARVAVLTVESLEGEDLEDYARRVATAWGVGDAGRDNGVLVLHTEHDRQVRLEVADGARERINDGDAQDVVDTMTDRFGDDEFAAGYTEGIDAVYELARGGEPSPSSTSTSSFGGGGGFTGGGASGSY